MAKRLLASVLLLLLLSGCWNYRGLDQIEIVAGMALDFDEETESFLMNYEVVDMDGDDKRAGIRAKNIYSHGPSLFSLARNAKRKGANRLFLGSAHILIVSQQLAEEQGVLPVIEWFLRDGECRETMCVAISREGTADIIFQQPPDTEGLMSITLHEIIREDRRISASSDDIHLYEIYNKVKSPRKSVMLPAVHRVENGEHMISGVDGIAILREDKLVGFLTPEQAEFALIIENRLKGGLITMSMADVPGDDVVLEIFTNQTKRSFSVEDGTITFYLDTLMNVSVGENRNRLEVMDLKVIRQIEDAAAQLIEESIASLFETVHKEYQADVFGFGETIYQQDYPLWQELESDWGKILPDLEVVVNAEVHIMNSGFIK